MDTLRGGAGQGGLSSVALPASAPSHSDILMDGVPQGGRSGQTEGDPLVRVTFGRNPYIYIVAKGPPSGERERHLAKGPPSAAFLILKI